MRIVSLLPSATEIVCALGLRDDLVGVSHCCDYPPEIEGVAVVTRPRPAGDRGPAVHLFMDNEIGPGELDVEALRAAQPDLVIVRDASAGSGIGGRQVREALGESAGQPVIVSLDPVSVEGIFHSITTIGAMVEAEDDAMELLEALREELGDLEQQVIVRQDEGIRAPRVVMLQGLEPPFASGRWVPEQVRRAGGWDLLGREGESASPIDWETVRDVDPRDAADGAGRDASAGGEARVRADATAGVLARHGGGPSRSRLHRRTGLLRAAGPADRGRRGHAGRDLRLQRLRRHLAPGQLDAGDGVGRRWPQVGTPRESSRR